MLFRSMDPSAFEAARNEITPLDPLAQVDTSEMAAFVTTLISRGVTNAVFDPTLTRGFDYYTGIVFEVFDTDPANPRSLFGGGRFDKLVALFGGDPVPAVGFGMGDVTLADFLETHGLTPTTRAHTPTLYLGTPTEEDVPAAQACAETLRKAGVRVFVNLTTKSLGDQVKDALKRNIPYFAAFGKDEAANGSLRLKTLATSEEALVTIEALSTTLTAAA